MSRIVSVVVSLGGHCRQGGFSGGVTLLGVLGRVALFGRAAVLGWATLLSLAAPLGRPTQALQCTSLSFAHREPDLECLWRV